MIFGANATTAAIAAPPARTPTTAPALMLEVVDASVTRMPAVRVDGAYVSVYDDPGLVIVVTIVFAASGGAAGFAPCTGIPGPPTGLAYVLLKNWSANSAW